MTNSSFPSQPLYMIMKVQQRNDYGGLSCPDLINLTEPVNLLVEKTGTLLQVNYTLESFFQTFAGKGVLAMIYGMMNSGTQPCAAVMILQMYLRTIDDDQFKRDVKHFQEYCGGKLKFTFKMKKLQDYIYNLFFSGLLDDQLRTLM